MFQLLPCANCQRTFSLREDVSQDSWLKCPNCGNQFRLGDALDAFYAPWHIVPAPGTDTTSESSSRFTPGDNDDLPLGIEPLPVSAALNQVRDENFFDSERTIDQALDITTSEVVTLDDANESGLELELTEGAAGTSVDDREFDSPETNDLSLPPREPDAGVGGKSSIVKTRSRSSKGPSIWTLVQVMLGGAASIPVTLLLLWHVVGKDVMNAGPKVAQYVPWIVPSKFHHTSMPDAPGRPSRPIANPPAPGESGFRNFDDVLPMDGDKLAGPKSDAVPAIDSDTEQAVKKPPVETDTNMTELFASVSAAKKKIAEYDVNETNTATVAGRLTGIMDELSAIAERLAEVPADGGAVKLLRNDLKDIGRALTADPKLEAAFKSGVRAQFNGAMKRSGAGRVYLGSASEVTDSESAWQLKHVEAQAGKIPGYNLEASISKTVADRLEANSKVFVLGKLEPENETPRPSAPNSVRIEASFLQVLP